MCFINYDAARKKEIPAGPEFVKLDSCYEDFGDRAVSAIISRVTGSKTPIPDMEELAEALTAAGSAHHEYEQKALKGVRHEEWAPFYAAYVLGRLGDFAPASVLTVWLSEAPLADNWAQSAAAHVLAELGRK